ncbi:hypothetical protein Riv7116_1567 [Rivularia sp. PCC 7116]|uniref:DUF6713 family protein n=1 Tax=Rivularia sp. PCC 7116 TaxID=373994 RepID=UPI00029EDCE2|nr:DUF6713 family protein [Rivularia sp. PCC 7116]AFY54127.1 hypothetical protein Riv7116_1567 [Rivularia sp. PCC 7116]
MKNLLFYLGFATILTHELDAMTQSEWKLLFILRSLPEQTASVAFIVLHIPLIAALLWLTNNESEVVKNWSRIALAGFMIIHSGLHKLLENSPNYTFNSTLSLGLIYGAGLLGLIYLILIFIFWLRKSDKSLTTNL